MTTFDRRKDSFEAKFARDEELRFKATARRNRLLGLWAAEKLGKSGDEADAYAAGERYLPDDMPATTFYQPTERGMEQRIRERLLELHERDRDGGATAGSG